MACSNRLAKRIRLGIWVDSLLFRYCAWNMVDGTKRKPERKRFDYYGDDSGKSMVGLCGVTSPMDSAYLPALKWIETQDKYRRTP
jgi:hypothetical protein